MYLGNLPSYYEDETLEKNNPTFYADVLEPAGFENTALWIFIGIVALLFLSGKKKGGSEPLSNPPFYSKKHPQHVKGYYAHAYYRRRRRQG